MARKSVMLRVGICSGPRGQRQRLRILGFLGLVLEKQFLECLSRVKAAHFNAGAFFFFSALRISDDFTYLLTDYKGKQVGI